MILHKVRVPKISRFTFALYLVQNIVPWLVNVIVMHLQSVQVLGQVLQRRVAAPVIDSEQATNH